MKGLLLAALVLWALQLGGILPGIWERQNGGDMEGYGGMLDGDHTYVGNESLFEVLKGRWESEDGRWVLTISGDAFDTWMALSLDGVRAAEYSLHYTYLLPDSDPNRTTDLDPEGGLLMGGSETNFGELVSLYHQAGAGSGTLQLTACLAGQEAETILLEKSYIR